MEFNKKLEKLGTETAFAVSGEANLGLIKEINLPISLR